MNLPGRLFADDEELGKKDDDHRPNGKPRLPPLRAWKSPRKKRVLLAILGIAILYLFFKNLPQDLAPVSQRKELRFTKPPPSVAQPPPPPSPPKGAPPKTPRLKNNDKHYFEGPIKFYNLAQSLHLVYGLMGHRIENRNVLFAASSLKSVSSLIPLACEMTKRSPNNVHFVVMGRDDTSIDDIKVVNGVSEEDCGTLRWHDGRPDYSPYSTDYRMEISIKAGLAHINTFMHPQVLVTDQSGQEDQFFIDAIKAKAGDIGVAVIGLPSSAVEKMMWIATLDSNSLKQWNNVDVEILIHAPPSSSGSLIRLLRSIEKADYFGSSLPSLTIELPAHVDGPTMEFLKNMRWPPHPNSEPPNSKVTLRHRISSAWLSPVEASIRTIEAFYPKIPWANHVLVLSPQAELSEIYYHYLKYVLLEYRYSSIAKIDFNNLAGISLNLPSTYLNGSGPFEHPKPIAHAETPSETKPDDAPFFLWQAPNSDATVYFGEKWVELHKFVSDRFTAQKRKLAKHARGKLVSEIYPAWMEYLLELIRAKGYFVLYPAFSATTGASVVTLHNELDEGPEEFLAHGSDSPSKLASPNDNLPEDPFTPHPVDTKKTPAPAHAEEVLSRNPSILHLLSSASSWSDPTHRPLPAREALPLLSYKGEVMTNDYADVLSQYFAGDFSLEVGGCEDADRERLFCLDEDEDVAGAPKADPPSGAEGAKNGRADLLPPVVANPPLPGAPGVTLTSSTITTLPTGLLEVAPNMPPS